MGGLPQGLTPVGGSPPAPGLPQGLTPLPGKEPGALPSGLTPIKSAAAAASRAPLAGQWGKFQVPPVAQPSAAGEKAFPVIDREADAAGVPRSVARTVFLMESGSTSDPEHAGDPKGAYGPFQIEAANIPAGFDRSNLEASAKWAASTLKRYHQQFGDWALAGMAYNAGPGAVEAWQKKSGNLADANAIMNGFSPGTTNNPLVYGLRINSALGQEQAELAHRKLQTRNANVAQDRTKATVKIIMAKAAKDQADQARLSQLAMTVLGPAGAGIEPIQSPVIQGPLQALGAYGELITAATPFAGALAGRNPDVPHMPTPRGPMTMAEYEKHYGPQARTAVEKWEQGKHQDPDVMGAMHDVVSAALRGPAALATAEERYSIGSPGLMAATGHGAGHEDPRLDVALRMSLDMASANPLMGLKLVGFLTKAMRAVPEVDSAITAAAAAGAKMTMSRPMKYLAQTFNPYAVLRQGAKRTGAGAEALQEAGRKYAMTDHLVRANAAKARDAIYKGLTPQQAEEVGRRSQTFVRGKDIQPDNLDVPEPKKGPSLTERANVERHLRMMTDDQLLTRKIMVPTREFDPWTFLNMTGKDVWAKNESHISEAEQDFLDEASGSGRGKGTLAAQGAHKTTTDEGEVKYQYYDQAKKDGALSPRFDFADQFYNQLVSRGRLISLDESLQAMREAGGGSTLTYKAANPNFTHGQVIGSGESGMKLAQKVGARVDRYNATQKTLEQMGMTNEERLALTRANPDVVARVMRTTEATTKLAAKGLQKPIKAAEGVEGKLAQRAGLAESKLTQAQTEGEAARMSPKQKVPTAEDAAARANYINTARDNAMRAAQKAANVASGAATEAHAASKVASDAQVAWHISQAIYGPKSPLARRAAVLANRLFTATIAKPEAVKFAAALKANMKLEAGKGFEGMQKAAEEAAGEGFTPDQMRKAGANLPSVPGMSPWFKYTPEVAQFLRRNGATAGEASMFSRVMSGITSFYRMGIVYGPIRHPFINLPIKSLALGLSPKNLARAYMGKDLKWEALLDKHTAGHNVTTQPLFGGSPSTVFDTPLKNVFGAAVAKGKDYGEGPSAAGAKFLAGAGQTFNAAASRAWQAQANFVFNWAEKNMAVSYFRQLVEEGKMDVTEAANKAANAYWDSAGVNKTGPERGLNQALLFYPWLKSVLPIMMRAMVTHPQYTWMPYARAQDWNRATGDPRWSQESEGTIYAGQVNGVDQYIPWPGPQKYLHDVLSVVAPADGTGGLQGRLSAVENLATGEMIPPISEGVKLIKTMASKPTEPGAPNFDILWNTAAPRDVQITQAVQQTLLGLPFGQAIADAVQRAGQAKAANPVTILGAMSLNPYGRPPPKVELAQHELFNQYVNGGEGTFGVKQIEEAVYQVRTQPGSQTYKDVQIKALRDVQMVLYLNMRTQARILDPSMPEHDKKALVAQTQAVLVPIQKEAKALQDAATLLKRQEPKPQGALPTAQPSPTP